MTRQRFYSLKRPKIRQSWNKYNLYNLSRVKSPIKSTQTYFQQKWAAKAQTRPYHGETIKEKHWRRMFRPVLKSVVPMDPEHLAKNDGSEQAMGRGSGLDLGPDRKKKKLPPIPYMNMVYGQMERRLDTAIFRALFASSTRQARQFCIHGYVKMVYPGYQLNPGDMFQVEPERVLYATGMPKNAEERREGRVLRRKAKAARTTGDAPAKPEAEKPPLGEDEETATADEPSDTKETLQTLLAQAKATLEADDAPAKKKRELRAFQRLLRKTLSSPKALSKPIDEQLAELTQKLNLGDTATSTSASENNTPQPTSPPSTPASGALPTETSSGRPLLAPQDSRPQTFATDAARRLRAALAEARDNPVDATKAYATPWRPREWMSAFAFVPRYLEVHHAVCSAVYLRHPVARPGLAEVPTPFAGEVNGLAFNWYLRRR